MDTIDKTKWGPGPWQDEPDRVEFEHQGFPCLIVRQRDLGNLCGYVAVPPGHPWHGKDAGDVEPSPDVHGGLTYADACHGDVCHAPKPGEPDDVWWLGFDCSHLGDVSPGTVSYLKERLIGGGFSHHDSYRTVAYARRQCMSLAEQAADAGKAV